MGMTFYSCITPIAQK